MLVTILCQFAFLFSRIMCGDDFVCLFACFLAFLVLFAAFSAVSVCLQEFGVVV